MKIDLKSQSPFSVIFLSVRQYLQVYLKSFSLMQLKRNGFAMHKLKLKSRAKSYDLVMQILGNDNNFIMSEFQKTVSLYYILEFGAHQNIFKIQNIVFRIFPLGNDFFFLNTSSCIKFSTFFFVHMERKQKISKEKSVLQLMFK